MTRPWTSGGELSGMRRLWHVLRGVEAHKGWLRTMQPPLKIEKIGIEIRRDFQDFAGEPASGISRC